MQWENRRRTITTRRCATASWCGCLTAWRQPGCWWALLSRSQCHSTVILLTVFWLHQIYGHKIWYYAAQTTWGLTPLPCYHQDQELSFSLRSSAGKAASLPAKLSRRILPLPSVICSSIVSVEICAGPHLRRSSFNAFHSHYFNFSTT